MSTREEEKIKVVDCLDDDDFLDDEDDFEDDDFEYDDEPDFSGPIPGEDR